MPHLLAAAAFVAVMGPLSAAAVSPLPLAKPVIDEAIELLVIERADEAMDMNVDVSITEHQEDGQPAGIDLEPAAPEAGWDQESQSGVAFPIVDGLSLGVDYEIEETEDLAAGGISPGTASDEHESHNVLIRANIQFDLTQ